LKNIQAKLPELRKCKDSTGGERWEPKCSFIEHKHELNSKQRRGLTWPWKYEQEQKQELTKQWLQGTNIHKRTMKHEGYLYRKTNDKQGTPVNTQDNKPIKKQNWTTWIKSTNDNITHETRESHDNREHMANITNKAWTWNIYIYIYDIKLSYTYLIELI